MNHRAPRRHAFSLVELSIVLVILGLLTGGILTGQSLIRAAELRSAAGVDVVLRVAAPGEYVSPVGATALLESLP